MADSVTETPLAELLVEICARITRMEIACHEDCKAYEMEARDRSERRWRQFRVEAADLFRLRDALMKEIAEVEAKTWASPVLIFEPTP